MNCNFHSYLLLLPRARTRIEHGMYADHPALPSGFVDVDGVKVAAVAIQSLSSITVCSQAWNFLLQAVVRAEQAIHSGATYSGEMRFLGRLIPGCRNEPFPQSRYREAMAVHSIVSSFSSSLHRNSMAMKTVLFCAPTSLTPPALCLVGGFGFDSFDASRRSLRKCLQVRSVAAPAESVAGFDDMVAGTPRKYYMLGGKGGVGKTSCAASLAVKFANNGHPTLVVSTDPAHSLSDSFAQDLTGGTLMPVEGSDCPLFALEINPEKAREEFRNASKTNGGSSLKDFMGSMGLGMIVEQVMQFLESREYNMFTRIVFDTAPTGHTLRLLSLPDFLDASIGKILKLKQKIASATSAIKSVFGQEGPRQDAADKLEKLRERMIKVRELFHDSDSTEFVIVTIPTVMAVSESSRLRASLKKENVPVKRLIVNQVLPPSASDCKFCAMKRKDQMRALDMIQNDPELSGLMMIQAPLVDVEIRGVPALKFLGDIIWK
ncbi:ATPase ARSA1-like [Senna tora]|uniref:ATPase ARSA1-like n=1 Tax=Senna tora TaxID=362788 RepID=A0A834TDH2_9FABA|nr:ATPase ARSA1-like [Senna tora]